MPMLNAMLPYLSGLENGKPTQGWDSGYPVNNATSPFQYPADQFYYSPTKRPIDFTPIGVPPNAGQIYQPPVPSPAPTPAPAVDPYYGRLPEQRPTPRGGFVPGYPVPPPDPARGGIFGGIDLSRLNWPRRGGFVPGYPTPERTPSPGGIGAGAGNAMAEWMRRFGGGQRSQRPTILGGIGSALQDVGTY